MTFDTEDPFIHDLKVKEMFQDLTSAEYIKLIC